jgi:hypothetical protein
MTSNMQKEKPLLWNGRMAPESWCSGRHDEEEEEQDDRHFSEEGITQEDLVEVLALYVL